MTEKEATATPLLTNCTPVTGIYCLHGDRSASISEPTDTELPMTNLLFTDFIIHGRRRCRLRVAVQYLTAGCVCLHLRGFIDFSHDTDANEFPRIPTAAHVIGLG